MQKNNNAPRNAELFRFAFLKSTPVLFGYLFTGIAFGILFQQSGYNFLWSLASSMFIYAGSMQFAMVSLVSAGASLGLTALMTLFINSRHMFYGLSFMERFKNMGRYYPYMIFSLTDETYALFCSLEADSAPEKDHKETWFYIAILDQSYWITGSVLGALIGQLIPFDFTGIDFVLTALFIVILLSQIMAAKTGELKSVVIPACVGGISGLVCLLLFGSDGFLMPALLATVGILILLDFMQNHKEEEKE